MVGFREHGNEPFTFHESRENPRPAVRLSLRGVRAVDKQIAWACTRKGRFVGLTPTGRDPHSLELQRAG